MKKLAQYRKFVVSLVPLGLALVAHYAGGASFTYSMAVLGLTSLGVMQVPNEPKTPPTA